MFFFFFFFSKVQIINYLLTVRTTHYLYSSPGQNHDPCFNSGWLSSVDCNSFIASCLSFGGQQGSWARVSCQRRWPSGFQPAPRVTIARSCLVRFPLLRERYYPCNTLAACKELHKSGSQTSLNWLPSHKRLISIAIFSGVVGLTALLAVWPDADQARALDFEQRN